MKVDDLELPNHLVCAISGDIMQDPVMLESGNTFERETILQYFKIKYQTAQQMKEEGEEFDEASFFTCPVSMKKV